MKKTVSVIILIGILFFTFGCTSKSTVNANDDMNTKIFTSELLHVSLRYDKSWNPPVSTEHYSYATFGRYEGTNGFFEVSCATGNEKTLDEFVTATVEGIKSTNKPIRTALEIDNQPGYLIMPLDDEHAEIKNLPRLIVKYPKSVSVNVAYHGHGGTTDFFTLTADKNHIIEIAKTIKFNP